ncbi:MAG TPA: SprT family zinc-dependent metalloprotease [Pusillimonas sp.]|uniref:M48 family metallopeptidase n=1 Tax=Pusillimonas sp. TaxID=3040095 RepID=UPI002CA70814|nr:SprT family zinc-dependent metalloprotease [Pusillimonas sp.]HUH88330.1 SprT family zinc-dependent metalloprotease [Pusillimonas sp.]
MPLENSQLGLFEHDDASPAAPRPVVSPAPGPRADTPVPIFRPPSLPPGARWREVQTQAQIIGFVLRRSRRKSIGLVVNDDGLQVTAPNWATLSQVDTAIHEKTRWILDKLRACHKRQQHLSIENTYWTEGAHIPYFGQRIELGLGQAGQNHLFSGNRYTPTEGDRLQLALPRDADHLRVRDSVHSWLQAGAREWFEQRLQHFLSANGLTIKRWRLSSAATRWGSCSSDGNIMLNWRLIHFEHDIIDYVIVHEIAHLRQMNHSKDFWREVERMLPGFENARNALRRHDPSSLPLI